MITGSIINDLLLLVARHLQRGGLRAHRRPKQGDSSGGSELGKEGRALASCDGLVGRAGSAFAAKAASAAGRRAAVRRARKDHHPAQPWRPDKLVDQVDQLHVAKLDGGQHELLQADLVLIVAPARCERRRDLGADECHAVDGDLGLVADLVTRQSHILDGGGLALASDDVAKQEAHQVAFGPKASTRGGLGDKQPAVGSRFLRQRQRLCRRKRQRARRRQRQRRVLSLEHGLFGDGAVRAVHVPVVHVADPLFRQLARDDVVREPAPLFTAGCAAVDPCKVFGRRWCSSSRWSSFLLQVLVDGL
mmetsp:Transcript_8034/g.26323  ORF Transcript_8034/g.26323 Transcript_8034/m.26323 type:complete len:305 (-) Transcript_8034:3522-4436(-)